VTQRFCISCGSQGQPGVRFCTVCGGSLDAQAPPSATGPPIWAMTTIAMIVVAAAAGITWMLTSDSDGDTPTASFPLAVDELGFGEPQYPVDGRLEVGPAEFMGEGTVGPAGGEVLSSDGLRISVSPGAHNREVSYRIERKSVLQSTFPDWIQPVSPLYIVDNGGEAGLTPITVEVPAAIPAGGFAMGLFYDEVTGRSEAMPLVDINERSVTVATAHFSSFVVVLLPDWGPGNPAVMTVDTGFRPGVDDWPFVNYGSYVAPDGHCGGQSMSAMWHYIERRLSGSAALYGAYDNNGAAPTPAFWQDDSEGYRLASAVQEDLATGWTDPVLQGYLQQVPRNDLQYTAFMAAMAITGHPQFVGIWNSQTGAGHHMIVYGGDPTGLQVADPNYPAQLRKIPWDPATGRLGPYNSAANAAAPGIVFDQIGFLGLDALINWPAIATRWAALEAQPAGDGVFPAYTLLTPDPTGAAWSPLGPTASPAAERFTVTAQMPGIPWRLTVYGPSGPVAGQQEQTVDSDLPPGTHDIGILIEAAPPGATTWAYVDYVDVVVTTGGVTPTAQPTVPPTVPNLDEDPQMWISVGPIFGWSDVGVGSPIALLVSVFNEGPGAISNAQVTSSVPDCNHSLGTIPANDDFEYVCYADVSQLGLQEHSVSITADSQTGALLSEDERFSFTGVEQLQAGAEYAVWIEIDPPIPSVAIGQAATFQATLINYFPTDWGTSDPLILEVFTSHQAWTGTPLYTVYADPEGAPSGFAVTCTGPTLQHNGPNGSYLLELNGGASTTLTCTVPGVSVGGIGYYMFWAITYSGYDVGNVHTGWMVEVRP